MQNQATTAYTPVQYDDTNGSYDTQQFYGALLDASERPSEMLSRLSDALFFYVDQHCDQLQGSQHVEPIKYVWLLKALGIGVNGTVIEKNIRTLYDAASIPYTVDTVNGSLVPVLDRRGYLHFAVLDIRADPDVAHAIWSKAINIFGLRDPATNTPFPTPIPRSAFPALPDPPTKQVVTNWQLEVQAAITKSQQPTQPTQPTRPTQMELEMRSNQQRAHHETMMNIIGNMGGTSRTDRRYWG